MARAAFDQLAFGYDASFSQTPLGKLHRERVWEILDNQPWLKKKLHILEVNCGTGDDAMEWAKRGHRVLATDISPEMIEAGRKKAGKGFESLEFKVSGFSDISPLEVGKNMDLIFSNFGGLNCISPEELKESIKCFATMIKPGGHLAMVIMPDFCLWEILIFLLRGEWKNAFRRFRQPSEATILGQSFPVYYYSPAQIIKLTRSDFKCLRVYPIGFFLPPSGRNHLFSRFPKWLKMLNTCENRVSRFSFLGRFSDHYLIILEKA